MARWAISPIIGNGTLNVIVGQEATTGPYRAKAADHGAHVTVIPGNNDGSPKYSWCIVKFGDTADMTAAAADGDIRLLPNWTLDHVLTSGEAAQVTSALNHFNITGPNPTGYTVRQVLRYLADQLDITWSVG